MSAIHDVDLSAFCGRVGNLYIRHSMSPPFALREAVEGWIANGIPLSHCVDVIQRYLRHVGSSYSGSGDHNFHWLNGRIHASWHERAFATPPEQNGRHQLRDFGVGEQDLHAGHGTPNTEWPPNPPSARSAVGDVPQAVKRKSASADQIIPSGCDRSRSPGKARAPGPKKIHYAIAWLLTELAKDEQAASVVEAKALSAGIAPRTYDRARKRLGITSRRIGFGRRARYMIALPEAHATPNAVSTGRALDEKREGKRKRTKVPN